MRHPRKSCTIESQISDENQSLATSRQQSSQLQDDADETLERSDADQATIWCTYGALGAWELTDLQALPRFPHHDSFPRAKGFIGHFLEGLLPYWDLRVALFWLGFGLLDVPTSREPTMSLVPLCKDLETYADTALELGYDPQACVHGRPVPLPVTECAEIQWGRAAPSSSSHSSSSSSAAAEPRNAAASWTHTQFRSMQDQPVTGSGARHCSARKRTQVHSMHDGAVAQSPVEALPPLREEGELAPRYAAAVRLESQDDHQASGTHIAKGRGVTSRRPFRPHVAEEGYSAQKWKAKAKCSRLDDPWVSEDDEDNHSVGPAVLGYGELASSGRTHQIVGGAASSQAAWNLNHDESEEEPAVEAMQAIAYKVKLLHTGGWSESSGSEGTNTPPAPPGASSSTADTGAAAMLQVGGLDADNVEHFTVTFISDLSMHEDLEALSCLCAFCLDDMRIGEELCRLPCMHTFHRRCVHAWLERDRRCMLCRLDITRPCG